MEWYYIETNAQGESLRKGPWSSIQMISFEERGIIQANTMVWHPQIDQWSSWESQKSHALSEIPSPEPVLAPAPILTQPIATTPFAGFWIRGLAFFIDKFILQMVSLILYAFLPLLGTSETQLAQGQSMGLLMALVAVHLLIAAIYHIWFVRYYAGTIGKILLGLTIVRADGAPMDWSTATVRFLGSWLSSLTLGVGFLMAAFDPEKRTLHDQIAKTRVIGR